MHYAFGQWLANYKGKNRRVHELKEALRNEAFNRSFPISRYRTFTAVRNALEKDDCPPDWMNDVLRQCEQCWKSGLDELSANQQVALLTKDLV